jgi:HEAT repeat protein
MSLSVEKMINWSKERLSVRSHMEAVPESLHELISLIEATVQSPIEQRLRAASQLGDLLSRDFNEEGVKCLIDCIQQERSSKMVVHVIGVLGRIRAEEAVPVIIDVLLATHIDLFENPSPAHFVQTEESMRLRCTAANALAKIGDNRAIIPMMSILNNREENYRLRLAVAESLGKLGDDYAVKPLIDILSDEREKSLYLKESVAKALGMLGDIRAIEPLIDILESKRGIRDKFNFLKEQVIEAVGRIGRPNQKAADSLILALQDEAPSIRLAAVEALSAIGDEECLEPLKNCIFDENDEVAKAAIYAIYRLGGEDEIRELLTRENLPRFLRDELEGYIP